MTSTNLDGVVGLVGVGLLGTAIAERLLAAGCHLVGYDVEPSRRAALEALGGIGASSPSAVAEQAAIILLSLPTSSIAWNVVHALQPHLEPGALIIDTTTGDPEETERTAAWLKDRAVGYVDATVVGSSEQARQRDALVLVGGDRELAERARPLLEAFAKRVFHVGPSGSGARMKLVVNLALGLNRAVLAESLALAERCGVNPQQALEVLRAGAAYSAVMDSKGAKMISGDFSPQARLGQHLKDVTLIRRLASRVGASTPLSDLHERLLQEAVAAGYAEQDNSAIIRVFQERGTS